MLACQITDLTGKQHFYSSSAVVSFTEILCSDTSMQAFLCLWFSFQSKSFVSQNRKAQQISPHSDFLLANRNLKASTVLPGNFEEHPFIYEYKDFIK